MRSTEYKKSLVLSLVILGMLASERSVFGEQQEQHSQPNIVLLIADDLGYADLGFLPFASEDVRTPNLNRLGRGGVYFSNAYVTSPICSSSRAGIITGRYQERWGNYSLGMKGDGLPATESTIPKRLKELGYKTMKVGKNHFGGGTGSDPWQHGFDEFFGFNGSTKDYVRLSEEDVKRLGRKDAKSYTVNAGPLEHWADGKMERISFENNYSTDVFADEAVEYIKRDHQDQPFYLHVAFNAVHHPQYEVNPRYLESWDLEQMMWTPESGLTTNQWHDKHGWLGEVDPKGRRRYLACLFAMDEAIGRVLDAIDDQGIANETLVMFVSDNGGSQNTYACNGPMHGHKYVIFEGGVRVPLIARWPSQIPTGKTISQLASSLDIAATCVDVAGGDPAEKLDGASLLPLLRGQTQTSPHDALYWDQGNPNRPDWAIRVGSYKLHQAPPSGETRTYCGNRDYGRQTSERNGLIFYNYPTPSGLLLYNLDDDPGEQHNLAEQMPEKVEEMTMKFRSWRSEMQEPFKRTK